MNELPPRTSTDTIETYTYKLAWHWQINLKYVIALQYNTLTPKYINLVSLVDSTLDTNLSIDSLGKYLSNTTGKKWDTYIIPILIYCLFKRLDVDNIDNVGYKTTKMEKINELLEKINEYKREQGLSEWKHKPMQDAYNNYIDDTKKWLEFVKKKLKILKSTQDQYENAIKSDYLRVSDLEISNEKLQCIVKGEYTKEDILTIFDSVLMSPYIQHVVCYSANKVFQKVYKPGPFESNIKKTVLIDLSLPPTDGVILFTVVLSQVCYVKYTIESGLMETSVRPKDKEMLIELINKTFPTLLFETRTEELECKLSLYPTVEKSFDLQFYLLLHRTIVQPELFQFYLNESTSAFPEKSKLKFRYRPFWEIDRPVFTPMKGIKVESTFVLTAPRMATDNNYIVVTITSRSEVSVYRLLSSLIPTLTIYYSVDLMKKSPLSKLFSIPNLIPKIPTTGSKLKKELSDKWPEIFTPNYLLAKNTKTKELVKITTDPLEADRWKKEIIIYEDVRYNREVLPFPPDLAKGETPLFWFTSSKAEAPHVGYRENVFDDSPKYLYVPYSSATKGVQRIKPIGSGNVVSLAVADEGKYSHGSPDVIDNILGIETRRQGVEIGPNAIIRTILNMAMDLSDIRRTITDDDVYSIRRELSRLDPALYKQQLYDLSNEDIVSKLREYNEYFDPLLYSAGLEHYFGIDIYYIKAKIVHNVMTLTMELPRYNNFYCAYAKPRKCILVLLNTGIKSDRLEYPHCELIVPKNSHIPLFDVEISKKLREIRLNCHEVLTCVPEGVYKSQSMLSKMDEILKEFPKTVSQYLDPYGKVRAFTVELDNKKYVTIFCYPAAPLNLPHSDEIYSVDDGQWLENFCGDGSYIGKSDLGVWCKHRETGEVLYVRADNIPDELSYIGSDPLKIESTIKENFVLKQATKDRLALVLKEIILWIFAISDLSAEKFISNHLTYTDKPTDEDTYYDISNIDQRLPVVKNVESALEYIQNSIPVSNKKLVLHNKPYYDSISYVISRYPIIPYDKKPRYIQDFYRSVSDFKTSKNSFVLTGSINPLKSVLKPQEKYVIANYIDELGKLPVFYRQDDVLWIVQATHLNELKVAYNVCDTWVKNRINLGYGARPIKDMPVDVIIYKSITGRLIPINRNSENTENFYEILQLGAKKYAAMLRM
jgi:hypothetical protein